MTRQPHRSGRLAVRATCWGILLGVLGIATPGSAAPTRAFALTSDFLTGSLSAADLATREVSRDVARVGSDATVRWHGGLLYVVNRFGGDNIQVIDPARGYETVRQFSVGNGSNPQDIAFVTPTKAYVSRYGSADLLIVNPAAADGQPMRAISLAAFADPDGLPEMARMVRVGRYLFVACQRLTDFQPTNPGVVVVVDTETDTVVDVDPDLSGVQGIALAARNPVTAFEYDRAGGRLLLGCAGHYNSLDGGVEAIDPFEFKSLGVVATEIELGGDIGDLVWKQADKAYALVSQGSVNRLISWNPGNGRKIATLLTASGGFSLPDMEGNELGELYVCKNPAVPSPSDPAGLLVFDTTTDALVAGPLDTGLPPIVVVFDEAADEVPPPAEVPAPAQLLGPWPNPARVAVRLELRLGRAGDARVEVTDLAGRRVRTLDLGGRPPGGHPVEWDLRDQEGRPVPAGLYLVRARVGPAAGTSPAAAAWTTSRRVAVVR